MNRRFVLYLAVALYAVSGCNGINQKAKAIAKDSADIMFPVFDSYKADTKYNKKRFADFLQIEITPDVQNIYCYNDAIGIDASYQFAFNCNQQTAAKIIFQHHLIKDSTAINASGLQHNFSWWNVSSVNKLTLYSCSPHETYYQYFWYDSAEQKAYYLDFDT